MCFQKEKEILQKNASKLLTQNLLLSRFCVGSRSTPPELMKSCHCLGVELHNSWHSAHCQGALSGIHITMPQCQVTRLFIKHVC